MACAYLIVGLGNPGQKYEKTRHNAGFWFVDRLAKARGVSFSVESKFSGSIARFRVGGDQVFLLKPSTFMNRSGQSVSAVISYYRVALENVLVAHDELDLEPGVARLKRDGGHGGHNGLRDIISNAGGRGFNRLRLGIGHPGSSSEVHNFVLGKPSKAEFDLICEAIDNSLEQIDLVVAGGLQKAMTSLHSS